MGASRTKEKATHAAVAMRALQQDVRIFINVDLSWRLEAREEERGTRSPGLRDRQVTAASGCREAPET